MSTNKNEVLVNEETVYNVETGEIKPSEIIVSETADYKIVKLEDGTFKKNMKYKTFFSRKPETEEDKIELYKVFNDANSDIVTPLKNMVKKEITIGHVFMQPYQSFDEKSGNITDGVTTTIQDVDGSYYATSSKSVYYRVLSIMQAFGSPDQENYAPVKVKVLGIPQRNGLQIDMELVGKA